MIATIRPHWIFSRLMGKGFLQLQLHDERTEKSFFCECIPEFEHEDQPPQ